MRYVGSVILVLGFGASFALLGPTVHAADEDELARSGLGPNIDTPCVHKSGDTCDWSTIEQGCLVSTDPLLCEEQYCNINCAGLNGDPRHFMCKHIPGSGPWTCTDQVHPNGCGLGALGICTTQCDCIPIPNVPPSSCGDQHKCTGTWCGDP